MMAVTRPKRVLVVTSSYAPAMIADMHRARMLAWELPRHGWEVEVLAPDVAFQHPTCIDADSGGFFAPAVPVHLAKPWWPKVYALLGMRSIGWRALYPVYRLGKRLLQQGNFDLVYISTAHFPLFRLGALWRRTASVPYILDFHDPWVYASRGYQTHRHPIKQAVTAWLANSMESTSVCNAGGLVSVSPDYLAALQVRYPHLDSFWGSQRRAVTIPFGAFEGDWLEARKVCGGSQSAASVELAVHYVGAGGSIMARSFALVCRALAALRLQGNPLAHRVRIRLFGTTYNWQPVEGKPLQAVAAACGVGDMVVETPQRVSYRRSLELLIESGGALVLGVDDAGYMPSKLFSYALSGKPLLASLHRESPAFGQFKTLPALGHALWFGREGEMPMDDATRVMSAFLEEMAFRQSFDRHAMLEPHLAPAMANRHAELFEKCLPKKN